MARTITVIWNDENCDGLNDYRTQELHLDLTPNEVRATPVNTLIRMAMLAHYKAADDPGRAIALTNEAMKSYGLVGIINGVVEWLH